MREILVVNPRQKKTAKKRRVKKGANMPKKKKKRKVNASTIKKRRTNPSKRRRTYNPGGRLMSGLSIKSALKDQIPIQIGMLAAQWASKRFGPIADETDPTSWSWASYAKGGLGSVAAALIANMIKPGIGQRVLTGGISHVMHRLIRNEIVEASPWAIANFGSDDEGLYLDKTGTPYMQDQGQYLPLDERHRVSSIGETLVEPGPLGQLEPVTELGDNDWTRYAAEYS